MRISKKLTTAITGIVSTVIMWATGELEAASAISAIALIAAAYMTSQGLVDFGLAKNANEDRIRAIEADTARAIEAARKSEDVSAEAAAVARRVLAAAEAAGLERGGS